MKSLHGTANSRTDARQTKRQYFRRSAIGGYVKRLSTSGCIESFNLFLYRVDDAWRIAGRRSMIAWQENGRAGIRLHVVR
jgi:hypothetical protein